MCFKEHHQETKTNEDHHMYVLETWVKLIDVIFKSKCSGIRFLRMNTSTIIRACGIKYDDDHLTHKEGGFKDTMHCDSIDLN